MSVKVKHYYRPFCHTPGIPVLIPNSSWKVVAYPTKLELTDIEQPGRENFLIEPHIPGPVKNFTVMQDLDRLWVRLFCQTPSGFFSYRLFVFQQELILFLERAPATGLKVMDKRGEHWLRRGEELILPISTSAFVSPSMKGEERLHFGCYKKQEWPSVKKRLLLAELLPFWFQLGRLIPRKPLTSSGTCALLETCRSLLTQGKREEIGKAFLLAFRASFEGMWVPRLLDLDYQGFNISSSSELDGISPLGLLSEAAQMIRALFLQIEEKTLIPLPCLPVELHAGRLVKVSLLPSLTVDLEWSKKRVRRMVLYSLEDQGIHIQLPPSICSFRSTSIASKKERFFSKGEGLTLHGGQRYLLDRFQK